MNFLRFMIYSLAISLCFSSCVKRTIIKSAPYAPKSIFFSIPNSRASMVKDSGLTISKVDNKGTFITSKNITSMIINKSEGTFFQIIGNWNDTQLFFDQGVNYLRFEYGNHIIDDVIVNVTKVSANNHINFTNVKYNDKPIQPTKITLFSTEFILYRLH